MKTIKKVPKIIKDAINKTAKKLNELTKLRLKGKK